MKTYLNEPFKGKIKTIEIETGIGSFRCQTYDEETGQQIFINDTGLVEVKRISDAKVLNKEGKPVPWVGGYESCQLKPEEKQILFKLMESLFKESSKIENWLDGPYLKLVLQNKNNEKYVYEGFSLIEEDGDFSKALRNFTGFDYIEALDGNIREACTVPFRIPKNSEII